MPRELLVDPDQVRQSASVPLGRIEINAFKTTKTALRKNLDPDVARRMLGDMVLVRQFESMLDDVKKTGEYRGVSYTHRGPAHLSIGQEAAAVGLATALRPTDRLFGNHRSHGEVLAKGLTAISDPDYLQHVIDDLRSWNDGAIWNVVSSRLTGDGDADIALNYLLYGMLAETFGRGTGFNRGLGGSMHAFFPPLGIFPNNAIVGGSAPLATGAALFNRVQRNEGLVVATFGDAALGTGPVWESLNFASMAQLYGLMEPDYSGGLPVIFFCVNNFYGMGGQTIGETMAFDHAARVGAGVNKWNMHAQTIDGNNILAVKAAVDRARDIIESGEGPVLIDCQTYRISGHSPSDASSYRTKQEIDLWRQADPITEFHRLLTDVGMSDNAALESLQESAADRIQSVFAVAIDDSVSPREDLSRGSVVMRDLTFNGTSTTLPTTSADDLLASPESTQWVGTLAKKQRSGRDGAATLSPMKAVTYRDALFEAVLANLASRPELAAWGEENRDWGGSFGVYRGLTEIIPRHRLFNSPISEAAIVGAAVGYAMAGGRALVELMYADFIGRAGDEIFNQLAKWQAMSAGNIALPVVLRVSVGSRYGAQHSQDWSSLITTIPGLKVVYPATPFDAKGLLAAALEGNDPVVFFESQRLYDQVEVIYDEGVPAEYFTIPLGASHTVRSGDDLTILTVGPTVYRALDAANTLSADFGIEADVIDARTLVPFDFTSLLESVQRTGRLICLSDSTVRGSWLQSVASTVTRECFNDLDGPPVVLGAPNWITPPAELEWEYFVTADAIVDAFSRYYLPLPGRAAGTDAAWSVADSARGV